MNFFKKAIRITDVELIGILSTTPILATVFAMEVNKNNINLVWDLI